MAASPNTSVVHRIRGFIEDPRVLALLPALSLGAFALGGQTALLVVAIGAPALVALLIARKETPHVIDRDPVSGLSPVEVVVEILDQSLTPTSRSKKLTGAFVASVDEWPSVRERFGQKGESFLLTAVADRIRGALRDHDVVAHLDEAAFGVALCHVRRLDIEACIQLAARIQASISEPFSFDGHAVNLTASIGFAMPSRLPDADGAAVLVAAQSAMVEAQRNGPAAIRAYSDEMANRAIQRNALHDEIGDALEDGQIIAYYQPQLKAETSEISGFEVLARWEHPVHGLVLPGDFLPVVEAAGLSERLGEVMLYKALSSLRKWDDEGIDIPSIGVNFASSELRNPKLVDKISWELDRFDLTPDRLTVEILETVFSDSTDGIVTRNILGLAELGCRIDLDDFGTGHASIAHIQQFAVGRIKIDRSFVARLDDDAAQKRLVSAILTMAAQLEVETLAEGVETAGEFSTLTQMGCQYMQGYGIARPMPEDQTSDWIREHNAKRPTEATPIRKMS